MCASTKCGKKLPNTNDKIVICTNCKSANKLKFCSDGRFARFQLFTNDGKRHNLTIFQDALATIILDYMKMTEDKLKMEMLSFDTLKVTTNHEGDIVDEIEEVRE